MCFVWISEQTVFSYRTVSGSQGIRGYISVMVTLKFIYFLIKGIMFC